MTWKKIPFVVCVLEFTHIKYTSKNPLGKYFKQENFNMTFLAKLHLYCTQFSEDKTKASSLFAIYLI